MSFCGMGRPSVGSCALILPKCWAVSSSTGTTVTPPRKVSICARFLSGVRSGAPRHTALPAPRWAGTGPPVLPVVPSPRRLVGSAESPRYCPASAGRYSSPSIRSAVSRTARSKSAPSSPAMQPAVASSAARFRSALAGAGCRWWMNSDTSTSFGGGRSRKCWLGRRRQELIPRHPCKLHPLLILVEQG